MHCSNQGGIGKQLDGAMSVKLRQRAENIFEKVGASLQVAFMSKAIEADWCVPTV